MAGNEHLTPRKALNTRETSFTGRSSKAALKPLLQAVVHAAVEDVLNESASSQEELSPRSVLRLCIAMTDVCSNQADS